MITRHYATWINDYEGLAWRQPGKAVTKGASVGPNGVSARSRQGWYDIGSWGYGPASIQYQSIGGDFRWRVSLPPPAHSWKLPLRVDDSQYIFLKPDGSAVLELERGNSRLAQFVERLKHIPGIRSLIRFPPDRFEVFTAPGRLRAVLALPGARRGFPYPGETYKEVKESIVPLGLSPDGHRVAVYAWVYSRNCGELRIYDW